MAQSKSASRQELQIVEAFSSAIVPERIIRESNIKELIKGMTAAQASVQSTTTKLERARKEQKDGNALTNWWNNRSDAVQDAQIDLNRSIGDLTEKSSQLLIVNTAISKVLHDQQGILLQQQKELQRQADTLEEQNAQILHQQQALAKQQREINAANKGLMEAKGISQEQAQKLVGCVTLVTEAEKRIDVANEKLSRSVEGLVKDSTALCLERLEALNAAQEQSLQTSIQTFEVQMDEQRSALQVVTDELTAQANTIQQEATEAARQNLLAVQRAGTDVELKLETATQALAIKLGNATEALEIKLGGTTQELDRKLEATKQELELAQQERHEAFAGTMTQMSADFRATREGLQNTDAQVYPVSYTHLTLPTKRIV